MSNYLIEYTLCNGESYKAAIRAKNDSDAIDRVFDYIDDRHALTTEYERENVSAKILKKI